jgi:hypothetical protein
MSKSRAKGTAFESSLLPALATRWPAVDRSALHGRLDRGDFVNTGRITIEAKNEKRIDLSGYLEEAQAEAWNAGNALYCCIIKRRGVTNPMNQYVLTDVATLLRLLT